MTTCFWIEPYVLFKYGLKRNLREYFVKYAVNSVITVFACVVTYSVAELIPGAGILAFIEKMAICAFVPNGIFAAAYCRTNEFKYFISLISERLVK